MTVTTSHPALIQTWAKSAIWHMTVKPSIGVRQGKTSSVTGLARTSAFASRRRIASFEYRGPAFADRTLAARLWA